MPSIAASSGGPPPKTAQVICKARTRVPTPHGPVFLHIYHNNIDSKEHLAIVVDPAQLDADVDLTAEEEGNFIRSRSLDAKWSESETEMDRLIRGAYVGRLSAESRRVSKPRLSTSPSAQTSTSSSNTTITLPAPIIRIHSECYTGETIGSMRCDCGEQLDEAIRYISQPQTALVSPLSSSTSTPPSQLPTTKLVPGRGAVIYLRQEGRGIGLLEKIRAYNLQDMGHDTVAANILLGHGADERRYDVAAAILEDLGLGSSLQVGSGEAAAGGVRILTNNPDKVDSLRREGIFIKERLPMVPRSWTAAAAASAAGLEALVHPHPHAGPASANSTMPSTPLGDAPGARKAGATMIGGGAVSGLDLDKYLRTKVLKMGHLLELPTLDKPQAGLELVLPSPPSSVTENGRVEVLASPVAQLRPLPAPSST